MLPLNITCSSSFSGFSRFWWLRFLLCSSFSFSSFLCNNCDFFFFLLFFNNYLFPFNFACFFAFCCCCWPFCFLFGDNKRRNFFEEKEHRPRNYGCSVLGCCFRHRLRSWKLNFCCSSRNLTTKVECFFKPASFGSLTRVLISVEEAS